MITINTGPQGLSCTPPTFACLFSSLRASGGPEKSAKSVALLPPVRVPALRNLLCPGLDLGPVPSCLPPTTSPSKQDPPLPGSPWTILWGTPAT